MTPNGKGETRLSKKDHVALCLNGQSSSVPLIHCHTPKQLLETKIIHSHRFLILHHFALRPKRNSACHLRATSFRWKCHHYSRPPSVNTTKSPHCPPRRRAIPLTVSHQDSNTTLSNRLYSSLDRRSVHRRYRHRTINNDYKHRHPNNIVLQRRVLH